VLTLWGAVVAERLGFKREEALTLGRAVAGLNAYAKGVSLGLFQPTQAASANSAGSSCAGGRSIPTASHDISTAISALRLARRGPPCGRLCDR